MKEAHESRMRVGRGDYKGDKRTIPKEAMLNIVSIIVGLLALHS